MKTNKLNKVLIALDYDPSSKKVAEVGYQFASTMGAEVTLMHVITDKTYYSALEYAPIEGVMGFNADDASHLFDAAGLKKTTKHFLDKTKEYLSDESITTTVKEGDFAEAIIKEAKDIHADVIVMGSHSRRWLEDIIMGSVTTKVLKTTTIPLFIIPIKEHK